MALQSFTVSIGALRDVNNNDKNYVSGEAIYVKTIGGTFAPIFRDLAGASEIAQDGLANQTNEKGQFTFFVEAGDYILEYQNQSTPVTIVGADYFNNRVEETVNQIIIDTATSRGFRVVGDFASGFTYELPNDVAIDGSGNYWVYADINALPVTVSAGTTPSAPTYTQTTFNQASAVTTTAGINAQQFIDNFELKIFQSPTDNLTKVSTFAGGVGVVYEVRKTSDNSLATIYSDKDGVTEIVQNGIVNVSDGDAEAVFYIADGDYTVAIDAVSAGLVVTRLQPFKTVADMKAANLQKYNSGTRIEWQGYYQQSDGGSNWGALKFGAHTEDGGSIFSIDASTYVEANLCSKFTVEKFGTVGDGIVDDSDRLQAALYYKGDGNPPTGVEIKKDEFTLVLSKKYRITKQIHQPSGVQVEGNAKLISNPIRGTDVDSTLDTETCMIIVDFVEPKQSAWVISGYSRNGFGGLTDNDLVDPYQHLISDVTYTSGDITRSYKCKITGVQFYAVSEVASPVSVAACPDAEVRISTYGFWGCGYISTSWSCILEVYGLAYHYGVFLWSPNAVKLTGYVSGFIASPPTPLSVDTAPAGWQTTVATSYTALERYWTTGVYCNFVNAATFNSLVTERFDRARMYWTCEGITDNSPYIEAIGELAFQNINSTVVVNAPQTFECPALVSSGGGDQSKSLTINAFDQGDALIAKTIQSAGPKVIINTGLQSLILDSDLHSDALTISFTGDDVRTIYVKSTGDNSKLGLTDGNAVADLRTAIERLEKYGGGIIQIPDNETVNFGTGNRELGSDITVQGGVNSSLVFNTVGASVQQLENLNGSSFTINDLDVTVQYAGSTGSSRGVFRPRSGVSTINMNNCTTSILSSASLFTSRSVEGSIVNFTQSGGSISGDILASNDFSATGAVKLIRSKAGLTETGTLTVSSNYTEL